MYIVRGTENKINIHNTLSDLVEQKAILWNSDYEKWGKIPYQIVL